VPAYYRIKTSALSCMLLLALASGYLAAQSADIIFAGENIITMDATTVEAVAVLGDRIVASGSRAEVLQRSDANTRLIELGEQALLPGFIDAHGHFSAVSRYAELLDLSSPPVGGVANIDDIVRALRLRIRQQQIPKGELVFGFGYDDSLLQEQRHPNRDDLDRASSDHAIVVRHVSGHLLVANSMAMQQAGISARSENPKVAVSEEGRAAISPMG
jgi:predicted amidohydrolase YtcJ